MRKSLLVSALFGVVMLFASYAVVMAQNGAVTTTLDIPVSKTVTIPSGEGSGDTIPLEGEISIVTKVLPPSPIRVSALVSLSGVGETTATCYIVQGGSKVIPTDPYIPNDPYHVTFTTRLIALEPEAPCDGDPGQPSPPPITPPAAAVIYPLRIAAILFFDAEGVLTSATIDSISVSIFTD